MIQNASVLNTILDNGADVSMDNDGNLNITGLTTMPANSWSPTGIKKIKSQAEQIQKTRLTFTSANSTAYTFSILGYSIQYGTPKTVTINWTSTASNTTALTSAGITAAINAVTDFTVTATDTGSGVVDLAGHTTVYLNNGTAAFGPVFTVANSDTKCTVSDPLTVTFSAAPTGGRTATGYVVVPDNGTLSTTVDACIIIVDGGEGYTAAPTFTFAGGEGASAAATSYILDGRVIAVKASAGSSYDTRIGLLPVGTPAAIKNKYQYIADSVNDPGVPALSAFANLTDGNTYDEWVFSYQEYVKSGNTTNATTVKTSQQSLFVYNAYSTVTTTGSCANVLTLNSYWGVLANLRLGYKAVIVPAVASNVVTSITTAGVIVVVAGGSPALGFVSMGVKTGDLIVLGTAAPIAADTTGVFSLATYVDNLNGFVQFGMSSITAATTTGTGVYKTVKRYAITQ